MILEMPPISTATPTSVPIAQTELEGHLTIISMPMKRLAADIEQEPSPPFDRPNLERRRQACLNE